MVRGEASIDAYMRSGANCIVAAVIAALSSSRPKKHLKRLNAPSHWMLDKLSGIFVSYRAPMAGLHAAAGRMNGSWQFVQYLRVTSAIVAFGWRRTGMQAGGMVHCRPTKHLTHVVLLSLLAVRSIGAQAVGGTAQDTRVPAAAADPEEPPQVSALAQHEKNSEDQGEAKRGWA
eukprot:366575-Chlamydomonas_euryale.AAC.8